MYAAHLRVVPPEGEEAGELTLPLSFIHHGPGLLLGQLSATLAFLAHRLGVLPWQERAPAGECQALAGESRRQCARGW